MKIILDEVKKEGVLITNEGKEISRYSYKNLVNDDFTIDELKNDIEKFNGTLELHPDFNNIKELANIVSIHNWD